MHMQEAEESALAIAHVCYLYRGQTTHTDTHKHLTEHTERANYRGQLDTPHIDTHKHLTEHTES